MSSRRAPRSACSAPTGCPMSAWAWAARAHRFPAATPPALCSAAFELDLFGRVKSLSEAAAARLLASDEGRRSVQLSLIAAVASAELALRADDELLAVTQPRAGRREEVLRLVKVRFDGGAVGRARMPRRRIAGGRRTCQPRGRCSASAHRISTPWCCCWASRCRRSCRRRGRWPSTAGRTCPPACRPTCCCSAPTCAPPNSS
jgi:hypothetical protein